MDKKIRYNRMSDFVPHKKKPLIPWGLIAGGAIVILLILLLL
jgi:hypothetical protein